MLKYDKELFDGFDLDEYVFVYECHLGGAYYLEIEEIQYEDLYCETCGDADYLEDEGTVRELLEREEEE
jgi:hypothetical protein